MSETDPVKFFQSETRRLNYYNSQFLKEEDFRDEQLYHSQMRRFHNRSLHTWGVVAGLEVRPVAGARKVTVAPGTAIDRLGREIVLTREIVLPPESVPPPDAEADAVGFDAFDAGSTVYLTIKYREVFDPADKDTQSKNYRRATERPQLALSAAAPAADAPEVVLAAVALDRDKAIAGVSTELRRYAGSRIGSSADGKEFSIYADAAGAWHFFDGAKGADRLTFDGKGNVGIGTQPTAARLSVLTNPGPYDGALMDFVVGANYKLSLRSRAVARDTVAYFFDLVNNLGRSDDFLVFDRGNVGIGTTAPATPLQVTSGKGKTDAGLLGVATFSSKDETNALGLKIAIKGDTDANASQRYASLQVEDGSEKRPLALQPGGGNVGIGTNSPGFPLQVGNTDVAGSWKLCVAGRGSTGNYRQWTLRTGDGDKAADIHKLRIRDEQANADRFVIDQDGNVGIGTNDPGVSKLKIAKSATDFAHLRFQGDDTGMGEFEIVGWRDGWNINTKTAGKNLYLNRDASSDILIGRSGKETIVKGDSGNVGIGTPNPQTRLQIGALATVNEVNGWTNIGSNSYYDGNWKKIDATKPGVNFHMNHTADGQEFRFLRVDSGNSRNIAIIGSEKSYLLSSVAIGTYDPGTNRLRISSQVGGDDPGTLQHQFQLELRNGIGNRALAIGLLDGGQGVIQVKEANVGSGYKDLLLNPVAGKVGLGSYLEVESYADASATTLRSKKRMHIAGEEILYILNKDGVTIGKEWGGNGDLRVQGNVNVSGSIACGGKVGFRTHHGTYVNANADKATMRQVWHLQDHEKFTLEMACSREYKENITDLTAAEALTTLQDLNPVKYDYKGEKAFRQNLGFIAEEMPGNLASEDRKTISPFEVIPVLTRVAKEQQRIIIALQEAVRALQERVRRYDAAADVGRV